MAPTLRMLGTQYGYYPLKDPIQGWEIDSLIENTNDFIDKVWDVILFDYGKGKKEVDEDP